MELIVLGLAGSLGTLVSSFLEFIIHRHGREPSATSERITPQRQRTIDRRFSNGRVTELRNHRLLDAEIEDHRKSFKRVRDVAS